MDRVPDTDVVLNIEKDSRYGWLAVELLAVAFGWMPIDGNYFSHISWMLEAILCAIICNRVIPGILIILLFLHFYSVIPLH